MPPKPPVRAKYAVGDLVFAKVIGYPPWPARIVAEPPPGYTVGPGKYPVFFFGTYESAVVAVQYLWPYLETRHKLGIRRRKRDMNYFNQGLDEIENNPNLTVRAVDVGCGDGNDNCMDIDGQRDQVVDNNETDEENSDESEEEEESDETDEEVSDETNDCEEIGTEDEEEDSDEEMVNELSINNYL
ncbi:hepatoma-derived growth factor-related protein 3-like [Oppia nitens]|uniref:hepatoma-derived growth factor-related protein 3-like n=1 Tax=Oppia nitens TaxID=1686743 RepID=UPI0023DC11DB|nr:hepatoma-derived growth factor-related protein 3-like [Oppia nitens]